MPPPPAVFHALLRPAIIQILRATGFHSAKPAVVDSLTDLAARYLEIVCQETARHAGHNAHVPDYAGMLEPSIADVRLALQDVGAFLPERDWEEQDYLEQEDTRGVDDFIAWATGPKTEQIKRVALDGVEDGVTDYLTALKKRHSKTADDTKYTGSLLSRAHDQGLVVVEGGGEIDSIQAWMAKRRQPIHSPQDADAESRPPSSGLSSVGTLPDEMDIES
ncbi:Bromodomain associated domain protein [Coniella lustricola]|uniref:Bromodomain associated domain protein n=1 Tax=Coniella lustricola TaxID=2025994 RepID=A0A2T3AIN1_9PEZI|nr:Bromodomain associated domain protein [Coniella lustricola]